MSRSPFFDNFFLIFIDILPVFFTHELSIEPRFCLSMAISLILTTWRPSAIFWVHYFFSIFWDPRAFEWAPYCMVYKTFWYLTPEMPKCPSLKNFERSSVALLCDIVYVCVVFESINQSLPIIRQHSASLRLKKFRLSKEF